MWAWLAGRVLRNRTGILIAIGIITAFFGYQATKVEMSYRHGGLLPKSDPAYAEYEHFLKTFSTDGNVIVIATQGEALYTPAHFRAWYQLGRDARAIEGIDSVFSEAHLYTLVRNDSLLKFELERVMPDLPRTQAQMDSLRKRIRELPFYRGLLYNDSTQASLMMVFVNAKLFNTEARTRVIDALEARVNAYTRATGLPAYVSGLPWVRVKSTQLVKGDMPRFVVLSVVICAVLLLLFYRSLRVMLICLGVVAVGVVWAFGSMGLLGYQVTILQSVIAPLLIVVGVPNCVFLINAYHHDYVQHRNKVKALQRMISRVGAACFITNATKAAGFVAFCITYSAALVEFGLIATIGIMAIFILGLTLVPIILSFMPEPKPRHLGHLGRTWLDRAIAGIVALSQRRRPAIYATTFLVTVAACIGMMRLKDESRIVDDLPEDNPVITDLRFFERNFHGVMPLEVIVDTHKKGGALKDATLKRLDRLTDTLATYPEFSKPLSIVDAVKFTRQAFYGGDPGRYGLLTGTDKRFMLPYIENIGKRGGARGQQDRSMGKAFMDSTRSTTRLTVQMADVGTTRMDELLTKLRAQADSIFPTDRYTVTFTGSSVVFLKGSGYLVSNLISSLFWAIVIIVVLMALLFNSVRILVVALIPNVVPLIVTAGLMGFLGIAIKPSTMLVFGIALGIAVDNAIFFLARYRLEVKLTGGNLARSVDNAVREVSVGIIYTSVVLVAGFCMFAFSRFGGIQAMGVLTTITLLVAMLTNLLVLPSLVLSLNKRIMSKAFNEPMLQILDEEEDIELGALTVEQPPKPITPAP
ncbi:MAG: MMPL family transporter [Flavobacteriales bacterium]|nr:MMPL family transporter [Flavobacteriales bacterium]